MALAALSSLDVYAVEEEINAPEAQLTRPTWFGEGAVDATTSTGLGLLGETAARDASQLIPGATVTLRGERSQRFCDADQCQSAQGLTFDVVDAGGGLVSLKTGGCWDQSGKNQVTCTKGKPSCTHTTYNADDDP